MKVIEKLFVEKVGFDTKARRRTNTSKKKANITIDEIESGVTLEHLMNLNVPVYRYQTQLTIHGKLPSLTTGYIAGYKSLVENGNGSIGVRYNAIDREKKEIMDRCYRVSKNTPYVKTDSRGTTLFKSCKDINDCKKLLNKIPDNFIGQKYGAIDAWGHYFVCVELMAIPESNLWEFCSQVYGIESIAVLENLEMVKRVAREKEQSDRLVKRQKELKLIENDKNDFIDSISTDGYSVTKIDWTTSGTYYVILKTSKGFKLSPFTIDRINGKGQMKYQIGDVFDEQKPYNSILKRKFKDQMNNRVDKNKIVKLV